MTAKQILTKAGLQSTFWGRRIIAAEKRGSFTESDRSRSAKWVTCACGKLAPGIPRYYDSPRDTVLAKLGIEFCLLSEFADAQKQARLLVRIERRAAQVLKCCVRKRKQPAKCEAARAARAT